MDVLGNKELARLIKKLSVSKSDYDNRKIYCSNCRTASVHVHLKKRENFENFVLLTSVVHFSDILKEQYNVVKWFSPRLLHSSVQSWIRTSRSCRSILSKSRCWVMNMKCRNTSGWLRRRLEQAVAGRSVRTWYTWMHTGQTYNDQIHQPCPKYHQTRTISLLLISSSLNSLLIQT